MNLTKAMADLFIQVKEWAQPALNELAARVDDREAAIRKDFEGQIAELRAQLADAKAYAKPELDIDAIAKQAASLIPAPEKGEKGDPGFSVHVSRADLQPSIDEAVQAIRAECKQAVDNAIAAIPAPEKGEKGDSVTIEQIMPLIDKAVAAIPVPKDGKDGENGKDGEKGADGIGQAGCMIDRDGCLIITLTNGEAKNLGQVVGKDGENGKNGMSLEAFDLEYIEETHEINVKASCAGRVKEIRYPAGGIRPAGYWREGTKSKAGDAWVHDGSLWLAKKDTASKPANPSDDWVLAARKGRDAEPQPKKGPEGTVPLK